MAPWRNCRSVPLTSGIEWCLCVGVMHHSQRPSFLLQDQHFTGSYQVTQLSQIFFLLLHPLTSLACSITQGIVALVELLFNNKMSFWSSEEVQYLQSRINSQDKQSE